tara:strand:- start:642 stop:1049 length:408 start_codon:yes stop_codon:yes gene_type:complete
MINSMEANIGDCCYFLIRGINKPKYGTIVAVHKRESAVQVMEALDSKFYVIWEKNAAWDEKELKGQKWEMPHNYHRDIPEDPNEKELDERKRDVHHGKKTKPKIKRAKKRSSSVSKRTSGKQKPVRSTRKSKSKT